MSLQKAMEVHSEIVSRPGMGINSPLVRRLQEIIKTAYGREGIEAIKQARIEASKVAGSNINALVRRGQSESAPVKRAGEARLQRIAQRAANGAPPSSARQLTSREQRNLQRAALQGTQTQKSIPELEDGENAVEVKPNLAKVEGPLTPTDVLNLAEMSPKEIIETFGPNRIDLTLESMGQSLTGSDRQRASRLKKLIIAE